MSMAPTRSRLRLKCRGDGRADAGLAPATITVHFHRFVMRVPGLFPARW